MSGSWQSTTVTQWAFALVVVIVMHRWWFFYGNGHPSPIQNFVPSSTPLATKFKRKALLIGIEGYSDTGWKPLLAHRDTLGMRQLLIDVYHYDPLDITMLIDNKPDQIQPTRDNMIQKIKDLIDGARQGDRFFFYYSSPARQENSNDASEGGLDELIITSDEKTIRDRELFELLAEPLPIGSTLVTVFDCFHSGSMLDLKHSHCNRVYVPWLNKGVCHTLLQNNTMWRNTYLDKACIIWTPSSESTDHSLILDRPLVRCSSPELMFCNGRCREAGILQHEIELGADIICLSCAKASQSNWECSTGQSMTQILIETLRENPSLSLRDLLTVVCHKIHAVYSNLHTAPGKYRPQLKDFNGRRLQGGKLQFRRRFFKMDNFQEPGFSSALPLDMSRPWRL